MNHSIFQDTTILPPAKEDPAEDDAILEKEPWIEQPIRVDYGYNVKLGQGVFINFDCVIIDTCLVTIGARTLLGPKVSLYSGTHPLDPDLRNGTSGPESGKEIHIGEDCWLAGNVTVLPGVTIGNGAVIGAGSVVTKVRMLALAHLSVKLGNWY
ncbi:trimeric LpxA-like protein [Aspergillus recurvatus]